MNELETQQEHVEGQLGEMIEKAKEYADLLEQAQDTIYSLSEAKLNELNEPAQETEDTGKVVVLFASVSAQKFKDGAELSPFVPFRVSPGPSFFGRAGEGD